jgi:hypothetical protein
VSPEIHKVLHGKLRAPISDASDKHFGMTGSPRRS